jgi:TRAP transporter TAXI family solute receptor
MRSVYRSLLVLLLALTCVACSRGPDQAGLARDVQVRLDALFGRPVLVLSDLNRQGSAPFSAAPDGARQVIVYYNATLQFAEAYDPSDWEGLSPQLIASALGATDEGIVGLAAGNMAPGSQLRAYGSLVYRREGDAWRPSDLPAARQADEPAAASGAAGSLTNELIQRLAQLVDTSPGQRAIRDEIVAEELDRALQNIQLRLDQGTTTAAMATGPEGGEYARFVTSVATRLGGPVRINVANTEGSVANAFMVNRGDARFGLMQSDVAAAAVTGSGLFAATGPMNHLRAVASLFPEPLHVIVRADAGIAAVSELAGRRVSLGNPGSGTRYTAARVLAAHGIAADAYVEVAAAGPRDALQQLAAGEVDAVVEVVSAPWAQLAALAEGTPFRLLPLDPQAVELIQAEVHGVLPLVIPSRTYPGQDRPVPTVAATALLVAHSDTPELIVTSVLEILFTASSVPARGVSAARLSRERALVGITIPLHDGAVRYFEQQAPAGAADASTKSIQSR